MKNALVWGASGAIGQAVLSKLSAEGWTTVGIVRDSLKTPQMTDFMFETRFENPRDIEETAYLVSQDISDINFWCYAAGDISSVKVSEMVPMDWQRIINANLNGAFYAIHHFLPLLSETAHIFFIGAMSERLRLPGLSAYAASKAGLEAFAEALGKEERKKRITIVRPGAVVTPFWDKVPLRLPKDAAPAEKVAERIYEAYLAEHKGQLDLT
jgi:NAD(P)-dependent dehydrogenase (short-subunit alcohol dehydrogenase family)